MNSNRKHILADGLVAGLIGYVVTVVIFAVVNMAQGRPFHATASQLGAWLLGQGAVAPAIPAGPAPAFAFNGVHLLLMIAAGMVASLLAYAWEREPRSGYPALFIFITAAVALLLGSVALVAGVLHIAGPVLLMVTNLVAASAVAAYLLMTHPVLRARWREMGDE